MDMEQAIYLFMALLLPLLLLKVIRKRRSDGAGQKLPPCPWRLPIIGSLHHLAGKPLVHRAFADIARRLGNPPLVYLKLGEVPVVVVSSAEAAREVMKTQDVTFATWPWSPTIKILMSDGAGVVLAPYGPHWRQLRKICIMELLSARQDLFSAGSETSATVLIWAMSELMKNPDVMAKAQAEVRENLEGKSSVSEDDLADLKYLRLVIKETLRLHPPVPLLLPREPRKSCKVLGYDMPKGTTVFVNTWKICRDPKHWDAAEEFRPERFESSEVDFKGTNFEYTPFGAGRRICPGMMFAESNMEIALAALLYHFDWELPAGEELDMEEQMGLAVGRKNDLYLHVKVHMPLHTVT